MSRGQKEPTVSKVILSLTPIIKKSSEHALLVYVYYMNIYIVSKYDYQYISKAYFLSFYIKVNINTSLNIFSLSHNGSY